MAPQRVRGSSPDGCPSFWACWGLLGTNRCAWGSSRGGTEGPGAVPRCSKGAGASSPSVVIPGHGQSGDLGGQLRLHGWKDKLKMDTGLGCRK